MISYVGHSSNAINFLGYNVSYLLRKKLLVKVMRRAINVCTMLRNYQRYGNVNHSANIWSPRTYIKMGFNGKRPQITEHDINNLYSL